MDIKPISQQLQIPTGQQVHTIEVPGNSSPLLSRNVIDITAADLLSHHFSLQSFDPKKGLYSKDPS